MAGSARNFKFKAKIWLYQGPAAWHFITMPKKISADIKKLTFGKSVWGTLPVRAKIGVTEWETSLFSNRESGCYFLPLKAQVRKKEQLREGLNVAVQVSIEPAAKKPTVWDEC